MIDSLGAREEHPRGSAVRKGGGDVGGARGEGVDGGGKIKDWYGPSNGSNVDCLIVDGGIGEGPPGWNGYPHNVRESREGETDPAVTVLRDVPPQVIAGV